MFYSIIKSFFVIAKKKKDLEIFKLNLEIDQLKEKIKNLNKKITNLNKRRIKKRLRSPIIHSVSNEFKIFGSKEDEINEFKENLNYDKFVNIQNYFDEKLQKTTNKNEDKEEFKENQRIKRALTRQSFYSYLNKISNTAEENNNNQDKNEKNRLNKLIKEETCIIVNNNSNNINKNSDFKKYVDVNLNFDKDRSMSKEYSNLSFKNSINKDGALETEKNNEKPNNEPNNIDLSKNIIYFDNSSNLFRDRVYSNLLGKKLNRLNSNFSMYSALQSNNGHYDDNINKK